MDGAAADAGAGGQQQHAEERVQSSGFRGFDPTVNQHLESLSALFVSMCIPLSEEELEEYVDSKVRDIPGWMWVEGVDGYFYMFNNNLEVASIGSDPTFALLFHYRAERQARLNGMYDGYDGSNTLSRDLCIQYATSVVLHKAPNMNLRDDVAAMDIAPYPFKKKDKTGKKDFSITNVCSNTPGTAGYALLELVRARLKALSDLVAPDSVWLVFGKGPQDCLERFPAEGIVNVHYLKHPDAWWGRNVGKDGLEGLKLDDDVLNQALVNSGFVESVDDMSLSAWRAVVRFKKGKKGAADYGGGDYEFPNGGGAPPGLTGEAADTIVSNQQTLVQHEIQVAEGDPLFVGQKALLGMQDVARTGQINPAIGYLDAQKALLKQQTSTMECHLIDGRAYFEVQMFEERHGEDGKDLYAAALEMQGNGTYLNVGTSEDAAEAEHYLQKRPFGELVDFLDRVCRPCSGTSGFHGVSWKPSAGVDVYEVSYYEDGKRKRKTSRGSAKGAAMARENIIKALPETDRTHKNNKLNFGSLRDIYDRRRRL